MLRNIPEEPTTFVGRSSEVAALRGHLEERRLVTITGSAGTGKSRLALHAASGSVAESFAGVCWADLWPLQGDTLLGAVVADAFGLSDHTPRVLLEVVCAWVGDQRLLMILDSCEHLIAECRHLVGELLSACPNLTILITSREPLGLSGELVLSLAPLNPATDALALFQERAASAGRPLRDTTDRLLSAGLCRRLEGLPLALELAAAQLRDHTLEETAARIRTGWDVPDHQGLRPPRHGALRTAVGWSHELCHPLERLLWARLSVFPGSFDPQWAEQICVGGPLTPEAVRSSLTALVHKSVISEIDGTYRMLDAIRDYGRMWLRELGEETTISGRHAEAVLQATRLARTEWLGSAQVYWYARMRELHRDVIAAFHFLLGSEGRVALELAGNVAFYWVCCGHLHEAVHYLQLVLHDAPDRHPARARGLWALGLARILQGRPAEGRQFAAASLQSASECHDRDGIRAPASPSRAAPLPGRDRVSRRATDSSPRGSRAKYGHGRAARQPWWGLEGEASQREGDAYGESGEDRRVAGVAAQGGQAVFAERGESATAAGEQQAGGGQGEGHAEAVADD